MAGHPSDVWASGEAYEPYAGRWSRRVAPEFLEWLSVPPGLRWLDVGCGTGTLTEAVLALAEPAGVMGVDPSADYLTYARRRIEDGRASFELGSALSLPAAEGNCDAVVSGLVLNFVPDSAGAVREMVRVTADGGMVAAYVWDYAGEMQLMRYFWDAAVALDPHARDLDEGVRFPLCKPEPLANLFRGAELLDVEVRAIDVPTVFRDFDDYWKPFLGGQGPAPSYAMSLTEEHRSALSLHIRSALPVADDSSIHLTARAWAVKGRRTTVT
ncbi:MAG: methyltransferase domain-containing protein [Actinomycetota bacterium]